METIVILAGILFGLGIGILFMAIKSKSKKSNDKGKIIKFDAMADDNGGELPKTKPPVRPNNP